MEKPTAAPPGFPAPSRPLPGSPALDQPLSRDPVEGVDLPIFAQISAQLAEGRASREKLLSSSGFDEIRWAFIEQVWLLRIAEAALRGDLSWAEDFNRLYLDAQNALGPTEPTRSMERYAWFIGRTEGGASLGELLRADGLTFGDWSRLSRAWTWRIAQDPEMAARFQQLVAVARSEAGP